MGKYDNLIYFEYNDVVFTWIPNVTLILKMRAFFFIIWNVNTFQHKLIWKLNVSIFEQAYENGKSISQTGKLEQNSTNEGYIILH